MRKMANTIFNTSRHRSAAQLREHWQGMHTPTIIARVPLMLLLLFLYARGAGGQTVTTLAGTAGTTGSVNGIGPAARFYSPWGIALDAAATFIFLVS